MSLEYIYFRKKLKKANLDLKKIEMKDPLIFRSMHITRDSFNFEDILIWLAIQKKVATIKKEEKFYFREIINYKYKIVSDEFIRDKTKDIIDKPSRRNYIRFLEDERNYLIMSNETKWRENTLEKIKKICPQYIFFDDENEKESAYLKFTMEKW